MYKILSAAAVIALGFAGGAQASPLAAPLAQGAQDASALTIQAQAQTTPARRRAQQPRRPQTPAQPRQPQTQPPAGGGGGGSGFIPG
jgi:hypothetical protein